MKRYLKLFLTGFTQVFLVVVNTYFISHDYIIGIFVIGFSISLVWTFNVKRIAIGNMRDRIYYSLGACLGSGIGYIAAKFVVN